MILRLRRVLALAVILPSVAVLAAQDPAPPPPVTTGLLMGRAVDATTGKAVGGAIVALNMSGGATVPVPGQAAPLSRFPSRVIADSSGRFVFHDLPKGLFTITATKQG